MTEQNRARSNRWEMVRIGQGDLFTIMDSMEDGVYLINQQYEVEYVNPAMRSDFGPVEGRKCYQYFHDQQGPCPWCDNKEVIIRGKTVRKEFCSAKALKTYDLICTKFKFSDGKTSKWGIFRDITERQKSEEKLKKYRDHLEELVEERTVELTLTNKKLEQEIAERKRIEYKLAKLYNREKGLRREVETQMRQRIEFTRALVHELKTPLTALLAASDLLAVGIKEEPYATLISNVQLGTLNLDKRIRELFDLAKGEIGMLHLKYEPTDLLQLLRDVADYVAPEATRKQLSIVADLPSSLPVIWVDRDRLQEVLLNLLDNACKFIPTGGRVTLRAREVDSNVVVEVQDTGPGISRLKKKRLFKPYYHQESDGEQFSGLGLGLALCKTLVELHGGQIWVESQQANSSTFSFSLPARKPMSL